MSSAPSQGLRRIFFSRFFANVPEKRTGHPPAVAHPPGGGVGLQRFYTFPVDGPLRREYDGKNVFGGKAAMKKKTTFGLLGLAAAGAGAAGGLRSEERRVGKECRL